MASLTQWTWVWANFMNWWRTGKPAVLCSWGRSESDMTSAWIVTIRVFCLHLQSLIRMWIPGTCHPPFLGHRMIYWLEVLKAYQQTIILSRNTNSRLKQLLIMKNKNHLNEMFFHLAFFLFFFFFGPAFKKRYEIGRAESTLLILSIKKPALKLISSGGKMAPGFLLQ